MAELVDALVSGTSGSNTLEVRVFLRPPFFHGFGVVAQLIERYVRIVEVVGLSPISSTKKIKNPPIGGFFLFLKRYYFFQNAKPRRADFSSRCLRSSAARLRSARRSWKRNADSSSR